jgi:hypothetical protein
MCKQVHSKCASEGPHRDLDRREMLNGPARPVHACQVACCTCLLHIEGSFFLYFTCCEATALFIPEQSAERSPEQSRNST